MKKTLVLLAFFIMLGSITYAKDGLQRFCDRHADDDNVEHITVPKFLFHFIHKDRETRRLLRCMKSIKIFQMENLDHKREAIVAELQEALAQDSFESLLQVNDSGERVNIYIDQDEQKIRKLLIVVDSDNELVMLQAKTKISFDELNALLSDYKSGKGEGGLKKIAGLKG